jgi:hypothetical protein
MMMLVFVFGCCVTFPVLFPVYGTPMRLHMLIVATGGGGQTGLDLLSFSNVLTPKARYFAPVFISWIMIGNPSFDN